METSNAGIIGIQETRQTVNAVKDYYRQEYKKIKDEQKTTNANYTRDKWRVRFGQLGLNLGLVFASKPVKFWGHISTNLLGGITKKVMQIKNKLYNKSVDKKLKNLEADFINLEGDFKQFTTEYTVPIEEVSDMELSEAKAL